MKVALSFGLVLLAQLCACQIQKEALPNIQGKLQEVKPSSRIWGQRISSPKIYFSRTNEFVRPENTYLNKPTKIFPARSFLPFSDLGASAGPRIFGNEVESSKSRTVQDTLTPELNLADGLKDGFITIDVMQKQGRFKFPPPLPINGNLGNLSPNEVFYVDDELLIIKGGSFGNGPKEHPYSNENNFYRNPFQDQRVENERQYNRIDKDPQSATTFYPLSVFFPAVQFPVKEKMELFPSPKLESLKKQNRARSKENYIYPRYRKQNSPRINNPIYVPAFNIQNFPRTVSQKAKITRVENPRVSINGNTRYQHVQIPDEVSIRQAISQNVGDLRLPEQDNYHFSCKHFAPKYHSYHDCILALKKRNLINDTNINNTPNLAINPDAELIENTIGIKPKFHARKSYATIQKLTASSSVPKDNRNDTKDSNNNTSQQFYINSAELNATNINEAPNATQTYLKTLGNSTLMRIITDVETNNSNAQVSETFSEKADLPLSSLDNYGMKVKVQPIGVSIDRIRKHTL